MFSNISYEEIPDYIIKSKFEHFLDVQLLNEALDAAHKLSGNVLKEMDDVVPDEFVKHYFCTKIK